MIELLALDDYAGFEDLVPEFRPELNPLNSQATAVINLSGGITPSGGHSGTASGPDTFNGAGSVAPTADITEFSLFIDSLIGEITPVGSLSLIQATSLSVGGEIVPFGNVTKQDVSKILVGSITPSGATNNALSAGSIVTGGGITPNGSVSNIRNEFSGGSGSNAGGRKRPFRPKIRRDR